MAKTIIKEIIIMLLLCLAIIIVLGLLLYDYVPMSKVVPDPVSYTTPEDVKQELIEAGNVDEDEVIMTYEVEPSDMTNYEQQQIQQQIQVLEQVLIQQKVKVQQEKTIVQHQMQIIQIRFLVKKMRIHQKEDISSKIKELNKLISYYR